MGGVVLVRRRRVGEDLAALENTLELLSNPAAFAETEQARREAAAGEFVTADELRAKYLRR